MVEGAKNSRLPFYKDHSNIKCSTISTDDQLEELEAELDLRGYMQTGGPKNRFFQERPLNLLK